MFIKRGKKGQVTLFVIIAIVIVVIVLGYFLLKNSISSKQEMPQHVEVIEKSFLDCIQEKTLTGISILESNGGYIYEQKFEPGSIYMPFSSHLDFVGNSIPYWFYISRNNIPKENVPTKEKMQEELERYVEENSVLCDLSDYSSQGYFITKEKPQANVEILDDKISVDFKMNLGVYDEVSSYLVEDHDFSINSKLGRLYDSALKIYKQEQQELFLENYGLDFLRLYAPVDGVELTCAPMTWNAHEVFEDLKDALEVNTIALKTKGKSNDYYLIDTDIGNEIKFVYSRSWPSSFEVAPNEGNLLISKPIGNQQGLGILGFCYVPYHFVYNLAYPVLIQIYDENEFFQFPVAVVIRGNQPRESLKNSSDSFEKLDICEYKNSLTDISVFDSNLKPLKADIYFECFGIKCDIGKTFENGSLKTYLPQCHNGILSTNLKGYKEEQMIYSSVENGSAIIILDRSYDKSVSLILGGKSYSGNAIISFSDSKGKVQTLVYPEMKKIDLSEGSYNVEVYAYKNSSLKLSKSSKEQCVEVSESGLLGILGLTKKECFTVDIPEQIISNAVSGGGSGEFYFSNSELSSEKNIEISADELNTPKSIEELQNNYIILETKSVEVKFK